MSGTGLSKLCWDQIGDGLWRDGIQIIDVWKLRDKEKAKYSNKAVG